MKLYTRETVETALVGRHGQVLSAVQSAYMLHSTGETSLPFSTFLRPAGYPNDRIIALPAHIGGDFDIAGIKWISSFPENLDRGQQRASSVLILNSLETGYPTALLESSQISATRTAASAALASATLHGSKTMSARLASSAAEQSILQRSTTSSTCTPRSTRSSPSI